MAADSVHTGYDLFHAYDGRPVHRMEGITPVLSTSLGIGIGPTAISAGVAIIPLAKAVCGDSAKTDFRRLNPCPFAQRRALPSL